jgi:hypothetical protein
MLHTLLLMSTINFFGLVLIYNATSTTSDKFARLTIAGHRHGIFSPLHMVKH